MHITQPQAMPRRARKLVPLLLALAVSHAYADTTIPDGADGQKGSLPGAAGTAGTAAADLALSGTLASLATALPVTGGQGGSGGNGAKPGNGLPGGDAGAGAAGSNVRVDLSGVLPQANLPSLAVRGGAGGWAGRAGTGGQGARAGAGGNGILNADLTASGRTASTSLSLSASGGDTGYSAGGGSEPAGNGLAALTLRDASSAGLAVEVYSAGGSGSTVATASPADMAGTGSARADVTAAGALTVKNYARGGIGAQNTVGNGGKGGSATAISNATTTSTTALLTSIARADGGSGGSARGLGNVAGEGGTAQGSASATRTSGNLSVELEVLGGAGGSGALGAHGGRGGSVTVVDAVRGSTTSGKVSLVQNAYSGRGGNIDEGERTVAGRSGDATSKLTTTDSTASAVSASVQAVSGNGGDARGASGKGGGSGAAHAELVLTTTAAGASAQGTAEAVSGKAGASSWRPVPGAASYPGNATARATVRGVSSAVARATAIRGQGLDRPGVRDSSQAFARAEAAGAASATAEGGLARAEAIGGTGTTRAFANGYIEASAYSSATGAASNSAEAVGRNIVVARSVSTGTGGIVVETQASKSAGSITIATSANVGGTLHGHEEPTLWDRSYAHATATPDAESLAAVLAGSPEVAASLAKGQVVGVGTMGMYARPLETDASTMSASFQFTTMHAGYLTLGLVDAQASDAGFGDLSLTLTNHGTELFSRHFGSLTDAQLFFSDSTVGLGLLDAGAQDLRLTADFGMVASGAFSFRYALGVSPVPEPQTWLLTLFGTAVLAARLRRRKV
ncbi:PEP-CTERM sorting domain-containing protein [Pseudoduganella armeniaca]|uniref:PEP-CTERM sorting domain-containing protein n=1 Tax=Pseudoduganella armeniaca TaxID=2072590 RepID=A0A2R4C7D4_9BURK|nr:PEP-CTERM sorting domain-containing protein [Pseudoduganella armeniaca]AVR95452.1 hypothetical protein C9I28_06750 [Pseudoduganella armeniaca]